MNSLSLMDYLNMPFVQYALIVGILISLCASLFGVSLVLKRFSFIGDGLSHVAFGAIAVASIFNLSNDMVVTMPVTIMTAILLLKSGQNTKVKGDAAIAMFSVSAMALGYLILNIFKTSTNLAGDVCDTLFGSVAIITLKKSDVILTVVVAILVILFYILFYNRIFSVTFDESFTQATGKNAGLYNLMIAVVTAVIIVLAMNLVGSLLISALIIFPALSAMRIFYSFKGVVIYAGILSVLVTTSGLLISILCTTPVGATIVACDIVVFFVNAIIGIILHRG